VAEWESSVRAGQRRGYAAFLGLGGVGETPETWWGTPPVTAACWPTVGAPSEKDGVGGGEKLRGR
jgi:hypothetical protein